MHIVKPGHHSFREETELLVFVRMPLLAAAEGCNMGQNLILLLEVSESPFSSHDHSDSTAITCSDQLLVFD